MITFIFLNKKQTSLIPALIVGLSFLLAMPVAQADIYKYLTKDGKTLLSGEKLKGKGNRLLKIYHIKKLAKNTAKKPKQAVSNRKKIKNSKRLVRHKKGNKAAKNKLTLAHANGRDNGIIIGCNSSKHLTRQARIYNNAIQIYSRIYDVDAELIHAIVRQESCFNEGAHSRVGAIGLMQLMPQTALGLRITDPWNPEHNLQGGIKYVAKMLRKFNGNHKLAIAAYNAGPGNVNKYKGIPPFKETRHYVKKVYAEYKRLKTEGINGSKKIQLAAK